MTDPSDKMRELSAGDLPMVLKRLPAIAAQRRTMARALRLVRKMNPKVAKLLLHLEKARRSSLAREWLAN